MSEDWSRHPVAVNDNRNDTDAALTVMTPAQLKDVEIYMLREALTEIRKLSGWTNELLGKETPLAVASDMASIHQWAGGTLDYKLTPKNAERFMAEMQKRGVTVVDFELPAAQVFPGMPVRPPGF